MKQLSACRSSQCNYSSAALYSSLQLLQQKLKKIKMQLKSSRLLQNFLSRSSGDQLERPELLSFIRQYQLMMQDKTDNAALEEL